jgi:thiol-disulfide isomerase/thioredoxin
MIYRNILGAVILLAGTAACTFAADRLTIGSSAPPLDIEHWLTDKEPITEFEAGKVYVIEFWATWCGPCVASMPHLRGLQDQHGEKVTVISVSDEKPATIEEFLDRKQGETTYRDITSGYWLATDPDGSVKQDYMRAADQHGIPTAFLVGKTGEIEWIGHPMRIDDPVNQVVEGTWDREAYLRQHEEEKEFRRKLGLATSMMKAGRVDEALAAIDKMLAASPSAEAKRNIEAVRRRIVAEAAEGGAGAAGKPGERVQAPRVAIQSLSIGDRVTMPVQGRKAGAVWGDAVYTLDSDPGTSAVHAGLVRDGETKMITFWVVPSPTTYGEANRNGVQSRRWGAFRAAFVMQAAGVPAQAANRVPVSRGVGGILERLQPGESAIIPLTGSDKGTVWGSGVYTGDSHLETAAVHAGVVEPGERCSVVVTRVEPLARYEGSRKHGVETQSWAAYPTAFTLRSDSQEPPQDAD